MTEDEKRTDRILKELTRKYPELRDEILATVVSDSEEYIADLIAERQAEEAEGWVP